MAEPNGIKLVRRNDQDAILCALRRGALTVRDRTTYHDEWMLWNGYVIAIDQVRVAFDMATNPEADQLPAVPKDPIEAARFK